MYQVRCYFNPRSPHGERQDQLAVNALAAAISIHAPLTGSDHIARGGFDGAAHFNPRSPHGERHYSGLKPALYNRFQSTLPSRGATADNL